MKFILDKKLVSDLTFTNNEIAVYCSLRTLMKQSKDNYGVTVNQLLYYATNKSKFSRFERESFLSGLKGLIERGVIQVEASFGVQDRIVNLSSLQIYNESNKTFVTIDPSEMQTILNNCKTNKYSVLRYFILLIGTFNPKIQVELESGEKASNIIGDMPIKYLSQITGLSESTIMSYNKQLEKLKLIYISHTRDYYSLSDGAIKSLPNIYSRYRHKIFAHRFANLQSLKTHTFCGRSTKEESNHKRRLMQRYNRIMTNKGVYSPEEVKEIYDYIIDSNKKYQGLYDKSEYKAFKEKIRDISKLEEILKLKESM